MVLKMKEVRVRYARRIAIALLAVFALNADAQERRCVRYLAADGNDANDGLTPATAWRTVERLNAGLPSGGTALLRCGDVFYGKIAVKGGIDGEHRTTLTSFGDGIKILSSFK